MNHLRASVIYLAAALLCISFLALVSTILAQEVDTDGDGLPDSVDGCPTVAGPNNGCPLGFTSATQAAADTDGDGLPDSDDQCPNEPGRRRNRGCPEAPTTTDTDGDGVTDDQDECPRQHHNGALFNGCPDSDVDGLVDNIDLCPAQAGPSELPAQGCPADQPQVTVPPAPPSTPLPFIPEDDGGQCLVATQGADPVNIRDDASATAPIIGQITASFLYPAIGIKYDPDGQLWYQLEQGGYVASWVVRTSASCAALGEIDDITTASGSPLVVFDPALIDAAFQPCPELIAQAATLPIPFLNWVIAQPDPCANAALVFEDALFGVPPVLDDLNADTLGGMINTCPHVVLDILPRLALLHLGNNPNYANALNTVNTQGCAAAGQVGGVGDLTAGSDPSMVNCHVPPESDVGTGWEVFTGPMCFRVTADLENRTDQNVDVSYYVQVRRRDWVEVKWYECLAGKQDHWEITIVGGDEFTPVMSVPPNETRHHVADAFLDILPDETFQGFLAIWQLGDPILISNDSVVTLDGQECIDFRIGNLPPEFLETLMAPTPFGFVANPTATPLGFVANPTNTPPVIVAMPTNTPPEFVAEATNTLPVVVANPTATFTATPLGLAGNPTPAPTDTPLGLVANPTEPTPTPLGFVANPTDLTPTDVPPDVVTDTPAAPPPQPDDATPSDGGVLQLTEVPPLPTAEPTLGSGSVVQPVAGAGALIGVFEVHTDSTANVDLYLLLGDAISPLADDPTVQETNPALDDRALYVAYVQTAADGLTSLQLMNVLTRQQTLLMPSNDRYAVLPYDPAWMLEDEVLVVTLLDKTTGQPGIYMLPANVMQSVEPQLLVANATSPSIAHNDRYIAYTRLVDTREQVFTMAMPSGREHAVTEPNTGGSCQTPAFDLDATRLYFTCTQDEQTQLYRYDLDGLASIATLPAATYNPEPGPVEQLLLADDTLFISLGTSDGQFAPFIRFDDGRRARNISIPAVESFD